MEQLARWMITLGGVLIGLGALVWLLGRIPGLRFGRLPGDIAIQRGNFSFYFPLATCLLLSLALTLAFWFLRMLRR